MSVLTKVFVVLVTVFSAVLMGVVLAYVTNNENYKSDATRLTDQNKVLAAQLRAANDQVTDLGQKNAVAVKEQADAVTGLQDRIRELDKEVAQARADSQTAKARAVELSASVTTATANVAQTTALLDGAKKEADTFRKEALDSKTKQIELAQANSELAGKNDGLTKQVRFDQETITKLKDENADLRQKIAGTSGGSASSGSAAAPAAPAGLRGQITAVDESSGTTFAQINIGSSDGVQAGMKFYVFSANKPFLGQLIIQKVDDRASAGYIQRKTGTIGVGDGVLAGS